MPILPDDPRLTAFALGEIDDADRPEIEAALGVDPEARALVEEIRATARLLTRHLQAEPAPGLEPGQREQIETRLAVPSAPKPARSPRWAGLAVAAAMLGLAATLLVPTLLPARHRNARRMLALAPAQPPSAPRAAADRVGDEIADAEVVKLAEARKAEGLARSIEPSPMAGPSPAPAARPAGPPAARLSGLAIRSVSPAEPGAEPTQPASTTSSSVEAPAPRARSLRESSSTPSLATMPTVPAQVARQARAAQPAASAPGTEFLGRAQARLDVDAFAVSPPPGLQGVERAAIVEAKPLGFLEQEIAFKKELRGEGEKRDLDLGFGEKDGAGKNLEGMAKDRKVRLQEEARAGGEAFAEIVDNPFLPVAENPLSTFAIDVDTASYSNVRRFLNQNTRPPRAAVRIEELVNYFPYRYPAPRAEEPFSVNCEVARCPWDADHRLVRIGLKGREIDDARRPPSNLVFLIDVSGSMQDLDKLPLLKAGMKLLVEQLGENDRVAIVVYAGREGLALDSTRCDRKAEILSALEQLQAGGPTDGGKGIELAYKVAVAHFIPGGTNRVILATDGDFNVGVTEGPELDRLVTERLRTNVFLSVLGFGQGNVKHDRLESLANKGNGQYCYIDSIREARRVLVEQMGATLMTIAKDVKIQVQFEPDRAASYRLIGYENRLLQARDFEDDRKDAGEIGAGHCVTALYEVAPPGPALAANSKLQASNLAQQAAKGNARLLEVRLRCKAPEGEVSRLITCPADDDGRDFAAASSDFRFASAVAGFGMLLRDSPSKGTLTWDGLIELASGATGGDPGGYRKEFLDLVRKARDVSAR